MCAYVGVCMYGLLVLEVFSAVILNDKLLLTILMFTCTPDLSRKICLFVFVCVLISCEPVIDLAFPLVTRWHCLFAECRLKKKKKGSDYGSNRNYCLMNKIFLMGFAFLYWLKTLC